MNTHNQPAVAARAAFSLVEVLVVITIVSILVAVLFPATQSAKDSVRSTQCQNNLRQLAMALIMYAQEDPSERLPPFIDYGFSAPPAGVTNLWFWQRLTAHHYLSASAVPGNSNPTTGVWRCPVVKNEDIAPLGSGGGYGPNGGVNLVAHGCIMNAGDGFNDIGVYGSIELKRLTHPSTTWLIGDTGRPKNSNIPGGGYWTWAGMVLPFLPDYPGQSQQPACRHRGMANVAMADGHVESRKYEDLMANKDDIFCQDNY